MNWTPKDGGVTEWSESATLGLLTLAIFDIGKVGPLGPCTERPQWVVMTDGGPDQPFSFMVADKGHAHGDLTSARRAAVQGAISVFRELKRRAAKGSNARAEARAMMSEGRAWLSAEPTKAESDRDYCLRNVSESLGCIYIHPRKTAGKSIENVVFGRDAVLGSSCHAKARDVREAIGAERFDAMYSFGTLRNPWDRLAAIHDVRQRVMPGASFEDYLAQFHESQMDWLTDAEGSVLVVDIVRFEDLATGWPKIAKRIGVERELPHLNESHERPYQEYYTDETRQMVAERCAADIAYGGYTYE